VISVTNLFSIQIGLHSYYYRRQRGLVTNASKKQLTFYHSFCEVTHSVSTNCKNDMWTEVTNPCRLRSHNC